jgi:hypothetical protein
MGIVQRFERKLQGAVGDAFARVFGGGVVPQEVEAALQQEAADRIQELEGGHLLAPNSYVIAINNSDHEGLAADRDLTVKAFSRHLEDFIRDQGWQTYGPIHVAFEPSPSLHTGQFRTRGSVDPDAGRPGATPPGRPEPPRGPAPRPQAPFVPVTSNPGAGPMTQNSGYDPSREPAGNRKPDPQYARNGHAHAGQDQGYPPGYQNGYDRGGYPQGGYDQQQPYPEAPRGGYPQDQQAYGQAYEQAPQAPGYEQPADDGYDYREAGYAQDYRGGYDQGAPARYPDGTYAEAGYQQPQAYDRGGYQQGGYDQQAYDQGYSDYDQGGYNQQAYPPEGHTYTATLQLEDGSGRHFQLREGNNIIGRGQEAQFRLPDTGVSRRHIDIRWDGQVAMLSDLGSTNGTTVNGAPVQDWQLADGDIIRAGHSEILVRIL